MNYEGKRKKKNNVGGEMYYFIRHPSAFILQKSARTVGSLLGALQKRNGNF
jgi:hypothetical protein